jgi:hypothetical protein
MQCKAEQFHLIDMASQAEAVQAHLSGLPHEAKLNWLAAHGSLDLVPTRSPGARYVYRFTSHIGFECLFFLDADDFVFIGDHTTWVVPRRTGSVA